MNTASIHIKQTPEGYPFVALAQSDNGLLGRGVDWTRDKAVLKARMEWLERTACVTPLHCGLVWGASEDFPGKTRGLAVDPDEPRWWCTAHALESDEKVYFPLEYAQLGSACTVANPVILKNSSGFSAHVSRQKAIHHGTCEILERKGIDTLWNNPITLTYCPDAQNDEIERLTHIFLENGYAVRLALAHPLPGFHACLCIVREIGARNDKPAMVVGSGGDPDIIAAVSKSMMEAYAQLINAIELHTQGSHKNTFTFYFDHQNAAQLCQLWIHAENDKSLPKSTTGLLPTTGIYYIDRNLPAAGYDQTFIIQTLIPDMDVQTIDSPGYAEMPCPFV